MKFKGHPKTGILFVLFLSCCASVALIFLSFCMDDYGNFIEAASFADLDADRTGTVILGLVTLIFFAILFILVLNSAKYWLTDEYLRIKRSKSRRQAGWINGKFKGGIEHTDIEIYYRDILGTSVYQLGRKSYLNILYWAGKHTETISISLPIPRKKDLFISTLAYRARKSDFSHIISPEFLDSRHGGSIYIDSLDTGLLIEMEKCAFFDKNQLMPDMSIALIEDRGRVILLGHCQMVNLDKIISTMPPKAEIAPYILCHYAYLMHTDYRTAREAAADIKYHGELHKDVRSIDTIAYNRHQAVSMSFTDTPLIWTEIAMDFFNNNQK